MCWTDELTASCGVHQGSVIGLCIFLSNGFMFSKVLKTQHSHNKQGELQYSGTQISVYKNIVTYITYCENDIWNQWNDRNSGY